MKWTQFASINREAEAMFVDMQVACLVHRFHETCGAIDSMHTCEMTFIGLMCSKEACSGVLMTLSPLPLSGDQITRGPICHGRI